MMGVVYHTGDFISCANTQQPTVVSNGELIKCSTDVAVSVPSSFYVANLNRFF